MLLLIVYVDHKLVKVALVNICAVTVIETDAAGSFVVHSAGGPSH